MVVVKLIFSQTILHYLTVLLSKSSILLRTKLRLYNFRVCRTTSAKGRELDHTLILSIDRSPFFESYLTTKRRCVCRDKNKVFMYRLWITLVSWHEP